MLSYVYFVPNSRSVLLYLMYRTVLLTTKIKLTNQILEKVYFLYKTQHKTHLSLSLFYFYYTKVVQIKKG